MQKNVVIQDSRLVHDLGTGRAYINLFVRTEPIEDMDGGTVEQIVAGQQLTLDEPITRDRIVNRAVCCNYPDGASEAAIRKGIVNPRDPDFVAFNEFVESVKREVDEKL